MVRTRDCHNDVSNSCGFCLGDYAAEFVEVVLATAAGEHAIMTREEFDGWLAKTKPTASPDQD